MLGYGGGFSDLASISQWYRCFTEYLGEVPEDVVERYGDIARRLQSACKYDSSNLATATLSIAFTRGLQRPLHVSLSKLRTETLRIKTCLINFIDGDQSKKKQSNGPNFYVVA